MECFIGYTLKDAIFYDFTIEGNKKEGQGRTRTGKRVSRKKSKEVGDDEGIKGPFSRPVYKGI